MDGLPGGGPMTYDLLIVGSGSAGVAAALEASALGAKAAVVEAGVLGGPASTWGACPPSTSSGRPTPSTGRATPPSRPPHGGPGGGLESPPRGQGGPDRGPQEGEVPGGSGGGRGSRAPGRARFLDGERMEVEGREVLAGRYLLATGARPFLPPIPGLQESAPWTYLGPSPPPPFPKASWWWGVGPSGLSSPRPSPGLGAG